jgi:hypothetical protein
MVPVAAPGQVTSAQRRIQDFAPLQQGGKTPYRLARRSLVSRSLAEVAAERAPVRSAQGSSAAMCRTRRSWPEQSLQAGDLFSQFPACQQSFRNRPAFQHGVHLIPRQTQAIGQLPVGNPAFSMKFDQNHFLANGGNVAFFRSKLFFDGAGGSIVMAICRLQIRALQHLFAVGRRGLSLVQVFAAGPADARIGRRSNNIIPRQAGPASFALSLCRSAVDQPQPTENPCGPRSGRKRRRSVFCMGERATEARTPGPAPRWRVQGTVVVADGDRQRPDARARRSPGHGITSARIPLNLARQRVLRPRRSGELCRAARWQTTPGPSDIARQYDRDGPGLS